MPLPPPPPPLPDAGEPRGDLLPVWGAARRNRHVTVPLAVPAGFAAAGEVLAALPHAGVPTIAGSVALSGAVWWAAPHKWDRSVERWYARASVLAAGAWLSAAAVMGLGVPELAALGAGSVAWGIPWWWHKRPRRQAATVVAEWARWWQYYASRWGVAGSQVIDVTTAGVIDTLHVQLWAGHQHKKQVDEALPLIESALRGHVDAGMTRCEMVKGHPDQVLVHLKRANPHAVEVAWDESLCPGSVTGLAPIGKDEAGEWVFAPLLVNWFGIGKTRWGKSNELSVLLASWTACRDALPPWIIDLKGGRSARPWAECADWIATTVEEARLILGCAAAEVRARARDWYAGTEQGVPTPDVPAIPVVVDESHGVLSTMAGDTQCRRLAAVVASEGSGVNVHEWVFTQYGALDESVGTEQIRGNLPARLCFAVSQADHGQFALPDWAKLDPSRLENKGEFYWRLGPDGASAPCRGPHMDHDLVREIAARNAAIGRPPLRLFCGDQVAYRAGDRDVTWQEVYDSRHARLPAAFRPAGHHAPAPPPEAPMIPTVTVPETPEQIAQRIEDEVASIPDLADPPLVDPAVLADAVTRRKMLWARLLTEAPAAGISPAQLTEGSGMSRSWTHLQLTALTDLGVITKPADGRYLSVPGQDVWAGLERIREANSRLAEEARQMVSV